ncbi:MAG TPA: alpha/beta hydrolase, partial [Hypericibacter adhaerens]
MPASTITVFFATNRNPIGDPPTDFGPLLGPIDGTAIRFGTAEIDEKTLKLRKLEVAPEKLVFDDPTDKTLVLGSQQVFDALKAKMIDHARDTLIYVHGFGYSFTEALVRAAEFKKWLAVQMNIFVFTWPSDGKMVPLMSYPKDRADVERSGDAMARAIEIAARYLQKIATDDRCEQRLNILAHSMGNYALRYGVQGLLRRYHSTLPRLFDKVILAAADEDADTFEFDAKLKPLAQLAQQVLVYHTPRDRALIVSDLTKGNPDRLGAGGPDNTRSLNDKVSVVDVSEALSGDDDATNHQYYRVNTRVRADLRQVFGDIVPFQVKGRLYLP